MNVKHYNLLFLTLFAVPVAIYAAKPKSAIVDTITYVYQSNDPNESLTEAQAHAFERAKRELLERNFGVEVSSVVEYTTYEKEDNGKYSTAESLYSKGSTIAKGEWLETLDEKILRKGHNGEHWTIEVFLKGKLREKSVLPTELQIQTLNFGAPNGEEHPTRQGFETSEFNDGDFFGVRFKSPVNGYVALFIRDDNHEIVYTQMPYQGSDGYAREVKSNRDYIFLTNGDPEYPYRSTTVLTTDKKRENNILVVVFSKKKFHLSLSNEGKWFPEVELPKFQKWLQSLRSFDETAQVQEILLTIKK